MNRITSAFLFVCLQFFTVPVSATSKIIEIELLTDNNYAPYSYVEENKVLGIYPDIIRSAFALMPEYQVKLTAVAWSEGKQKIERGEAYGLIGVFFHGHDWPYMYPYSLTFWQETVVTVCKTDILSQPRKHWPQDYKDLIIGHIEGYDGWLDDEVRTEKNMDYVNFFEVPTINIALDMVKHGSLDCTLFETFAYEYAANKHSNDSKPKMRSTEVKLGTMVSSNPVYVGYSRKVVRDNAMVNSLAFQQALDVAIFKLKRSGKMAKIKQQYISGKH